MSAGVLYRWPLRYLLGEIDAQLEELDGREDINDEGGPNKEMTLAETLRQCRVRLTPKPTVEKAR